MSNISRGTMLSENKNLRGAPQRHKGFDGEPMAMMTLDQFIKKSVNRPWRTPCDLSMVTLGQDTYCIGPVFKCHCIDSMSAFAPRAQMSHINVKE